VFISTAFFLPRILDGTDHVQNRAGPVRRAFVHHRLATAPGEGPLADLATEAAAALRRTCGDHSLPVAPGLPLAGCRSCQVGWRVCGIDSARRSCC
jgi:hypothetical protein